MTTQRTQTQQLHSFFLFALATLAALIVSMWLAGTAHAQDTGRHIEVNTIFPAPGETVFITLTGFPAGEWVTVQFGNPVEGGIENRTDVLIAQDGSAQTSHNYECGIQAQILAWRVLDPQYPQAVTFGPWVYPCGGPPTGDAEITASNDWPAAGEVVTFTLYGFPRYTWIHIDFGGDDDIPVEDKEVEVFTDGLGAATTTHTFRCNHYEFVRAWPVGKPEELVWGPLIFAEYCPRELVYKLIEEQYEDGELMTYITFPSQPFTGTAEVWYTTALSPSVIQKTTEQDCFCYGVWTPMWEEQEAGGRLIAVQIPDTRYPLSATAAGWHIELGWFVRDGYTVAPKTPQITGPTEARAGWPVSFTLTGEPGYTVTVTFGDGNQAEVLLDGQGNGQTQHTFTIGGWIVEVVGGNKFVHNALYTAPEIRGPSIAKAGEEVIFTVTGTPGTEVTVDFGDGDQGYVLLGDAGSGETWHTYAVGTWTVAVMGGNALTLEVTADGNPPIPTQRLFLPLIAG